MVRRLNTDGFKALPLLAIAAAGLVWHVLACVESPMAFAPNGDLAFTTMEPYGQGDDIALCGTHTYRLMVLPAGATEPKVLEESSHWMISGPACSSDGQRIAYFRIPLLTAEGLTQVEKALKSGQETAKAMTQPASRPAKPQGPDTTVWPVGPELRILLEAGFPTSAPSASCKDMSLPSMEGQLASYAATLAAPVVPAQLVERNASNGEVVSMTWVGLPLAAEGDADQSGISHRLVLAYILGRPRYSPDGQWVYFCAGGLEAGSMVVAVNPSSRTQRVLGAAAVAAALSPDGKVLATLHGEGLSFIRTDGSATSYVRCETSVSPAGIAWADKDTLAILRCDEIADKPVRSLSFVKADGTIAKTVTLPEMAAEDETDTGQLALSPDGRYIVVAFNKTVYFTDSSGTLLTVRSGDKQPLAQPTFTPDGKQVAFKLLYRGEDDTAWVVGIAFFSPAGQQLHVAGIPLLHPLPQTQPAEPAPPTEPAPPAEAPEPMPEVILELPPSVVAGPLAEQPPTGATTQPAATSEPALELNPAQEKALEELTPELP